MAYRSVIGWAEAGPARAAPAARASSPQILKRMVPFSVGHEEPDQILRLGVALGRAPPPVWGRGLCSGSTRWLSSAISPKKAKILSPPGGPPPGCPGAGRNHFHLRAARSGSVGRTV